MCGIAGILRYKGEPLNPKTKHHLKMMGFQLRNRGPDDEKIYLDGTDVGLIFRRLSIIDLVGGQQPMFDPQNQTVLMVNGEIYNYQHIKQTIASEYPYKSASDAEVILPLYQEKGLDFLYELNGMFAIAIWDRRREKLILARDHLGIKPLFYTITAKGHLLFASEIKALLAHPECTREFDWEASLSTDRSISDLSYELSTGFKGIRAVPAGHVLIIDTKTQKMVLKQWWSPVIPTKKELEKDTRTEAEVIRGYQNLLQEAVHMQLMSDVEVAVMLSGGIDSMSVATFGSQLKSIRTFTILNFSTFLNGDAEYAHKTAKHLGLPNHQLYFPWQHQSISYPLFKQFIWARETAVNPEQLFKFILYQKIKKDFPNIKTVLVGQGSDEFNGGYSHIFIDNHFPDLPQEQHTWEIFMTVMSTLKKEGQLYKANPFLSNYAPYLDDKFVDKLHDYSNVDPWYYYQRFFTRSIERYNLWYEDRESAANQLEDRVPFLDHRIVQYCFNVPPKYRKALFWEKKILRKAMEKLLPQELRNRPKVGFVYGKGEQYTFRMFYNMLKHNNHEFLKEALLDNPHVQGVLNLDYIKKTFDEIPECPSYSNLMQIIQLASRGLLAKWTKEGYEEPLIVSQDDINWWPIHNWKEESAELAKSMGHINIALSEKSVVRFAENVLFVHDTLNNKAYIAIKDIITYEFDEHEQQEFMRFLDKIDGKKTIAHVLKQLKLTFDAIRPSIEEALEYHFLEIA